MLIKLIDYCDEKAKGLAFVLTVCVAVGSGALNLYHWYKPSQEVELKKDKYSVEINELLNRISIDIEDHQTSEVVIRMRKDSNFRQDIIIEVDALIQVEKANIEELRKLLVLRSALSKNSGKSLKFMEDALRLDDEHLETINQLALEHNDLEKAKSYFLKGITIAQEKNDEKWIAILTSNLANLYSREQDDYTAIKQLQIAININQKIGRPVGLASNYTNIANAYFNKEQFDSAENFYKKSISLNIQLKRDYGEIVARIGLSRLYLRLNDVEGSRQELKKANELAVRTGSLLYKANVLYNEASIEMFEQNYDKAEKLTREAISLYEASGAIRKSKNVEKQLALIQKRKKEITHKK